MIKYPAIAISISAALVLAFSPAPAGSKGKEPADKVLAGYQMIAEKVAPGIHFLRQADPLQPQPIGNAVVIEQSDGLVLVDSGGSRGNGEEIAALVRKISPKPVKAAIITHWHNDHPLGLSAIQRQWPNVQIIASTKTRDAMELRMALLPKGAPNAEWNAARTKVLEGYIPFMTESAAKPGISEEEKRGWLDQIPIVKQKIIANPDTYVVMPTITFDEKYSLPDAQAPVEIIAPGRANTDGDVMIWMPKQKVLATGDIVVSPVPYGFNAYPAEWIEIIKKINSYDFSVLLPGHGFAQKDHSYLDLLLASMTDLRMQAAALVVQGKTDEEAQKLFNLELHLQAFTGLDPWRRYWMNEYWLTPFIESALREARGNPLGPPPPPPPAPEPAK